MSNQVNLHVIPPFYPFEFLPILFYYYFSCSTTLHVNLVG